MINRLRMSLDYRQYKATHWGIDLTLSLWGRAAKIFFFWQKLVRSLHHCNDFVDKVLEIYLWNGNLLVHFTYLILLKEILVFFDQNWFTHVEFGRSSMLLQLLLWTMNLLYAGKSYYINPLLYISVYKRNVVWPFWVIEFIFVSKSYWIY